MRLTPSVVTKQGWKDGFEFDAAQYEAVKSLRFPAIQRWHREPVAKKFDTAAQRTKKPVGRPTIDSVIVDLILKHARAGILVSTGLRSWEQFTK